MPKVPGPMLEILHRADALDNAALVAMGAELRRQPFVRDDLDSTHNWMLESEVTSRWYTDLSAWLAVWVRDRFGQEATWQKDGFDRPVEAYIRTVIEGTCMAVTAYSLDRITPAEMAAICRPWHVGQVAVEEVA